MPNEKPKKPYKMKKIKRRPCSVDVFCDHCEIRQERNAALRGVMQIQICTCRYCKNRELAALRKLAKGYKVVSEELIKDGSGVALSMTRSKARKVKPGYTRKAKPMTNAIPHWITSSRDPILPTLPAVEVNYRIIHE